MTNVAKEQAPLCPVNDQPNIPADPHRPEVPVPSLVELVELHPSAHGVHLEIEGRRLDRLLLVAGHPRQAVGERVGDTEIHYADPPRRRRDPVDGSKREKRKGLPKEPL